MKSREEQMQEDEAFARRLQQAIDAREGEAGFEAAQPAPEDDDAELAAAIALSLLSPQGADDAASLALARALQAEEDARVARPPVQLPYAGAYQSVQRRTAVPQTPPLPIPTANEIDSLEPLIQQVAFIAVQEADIHLHSRELGTFCREAFVPMDEKYQLSFFGDIEAEFNRIRKAIEAITPAADKDAVQTILNAIAAKGPDLIEPETGMNMMFLLVKSWALVEKSGVEENKGFIIHNLQHNIEAQGGCDAGIAARLIQPYTTLLNLAMQNASDLYEKRRLRISYQ